MPSRLEKKRAQNKKYYKDHKEKLSLKACQNYAANGDLKRRASKLYFEAHKEQKLAYNSKYNSKYYEAHKEKRKAILNRYYTANKDNMKAYFCKYYNSHSDQRKASFMNIMMITWMTYGNFGKYHPREVCQITSVE